MSWHPRPTWPPKCQGCGQFISYADMEAERTITLTPFGDALDEEPPDDEWMHVTCWQRLPPNERSLVNRTAWRAPGIVRQAG